MSPTTTHAKGYEKDIKRLKKHEKAAGSNTWVCKIFLVAAQVKVEPKKEIIDKMAKWQADLLKESQTYQFDSLCFNINRKNEQK